MGEAADCACRLERSIEEEKRCKPDIYHALEDGVPNIWDRIRDIKERTSDDCFEKITEAFDGAVDVAGIQTFANIDSLSTYCATVQEKINALKMDVDANIGSSSGNMSSASTLLVSSQHELSKIKFDKSEIVSIKEAKKELHDHLCKDRSERCPDDPLVKIREACKKIEYDESDESQSPKESKGGSSETASTGPPS